MNARFASRGEAPPTGTTGKEILVWDAPVRVLHWLMVFSFTGAYLTAESERLSLLHATLGYTLAGLVAFRIAWGLVGTRHARFSNFVRAPKAAARYLGSMLRGAPEHHTGHNPAGALAIVCLLGLAAATTASGWATYNDFAGGWAEDFHEGAAGLMLAVVGVHVAGVLLGSWLHRENLVASMISGRKRGHPDEGIRAAWRTVAALVMAAVLGFWWLQWQDAPPGNALTARHETTAMHRAHERDD
jgi:cytochrome b